MQRTRNNFRARGWKTRAVAMLMSVVMAFGLFPVSVFAYEPTHWAAPYMEKMEEWGVQREHRTRQRRRLGRRPAGLAMARQKSSLAYGKSGPPSCKRALLMAWVVRGLPCSCRGGPGVQVWPINPRGG